MKTIALITRATSAGDRSGVASQRGFTILELLVTMVIMLIVLTAAYQTYTQLLKGYVIESSSATSQMEAVVNSNLLRLDIAHAGYGIRRNTSNDRPIAWNATGNERLTIRSTINNLDEDTLGWILCHNGSVVQNNNNSPLDDYVFLDKDKMYETESDSCPSDGIFIGYPYNPSSSAATDGCDDQSCYSITYELSSTQNLDDCADGTRNLQRSINVSGSGSSTWLPVINCVADWQVAFLLDTTDDGELDAERTDINSLSVNDLYRQVEVVNVYALVQEGSYERDFTFSGSTTMDGINLDDSGVSDFSHYRWKVRKFSVKPQDM